MDQYLVQFTGANLDVDQIMSAFVGVKIQKYYRCGEDFYVIDGIKQQRQRKGSFFDSSNYHRITVTVY